MNLTSLPFPVTLVSNYLTQVLVKVDMILSKSVPGRLQDGFWLTYLTGDVKGKGTTGGAHLQFEEGL